MSGILNEFKIFDTCPKSIKQNIKLFHAFKSDFAICVTNDDKVFAFGEKYFKNYFGYEVEYIDNNYVLISELCDKNIEQFYFSNNRMNFLYARASNGRIFGSSWNKYGRGFNKVQYPKPKIIEIFNDKSIVDISFGEWHCLALTNEGLVYGWGDNSEQQFDNSGDLKKFHPPVLINSEFGVNERVKHIYCYEFTSFMVSIEGYVYILNSNLWSRTYNISELSNVYKIYFNYLNALVLKNNGIIEYLPKLKRKTFKLKFDNFFDTHYYSKELIVPINYGIQTIKINDGSISTYKNINAFEYLIEYQLTFSTILLKENDIHLNHIESKNIENTQQILSVRWKSIKFNLEQYKRKIFNDDFSISLNKFRNFNFLPEILESKVKYYYQIGENSLTDYSALFVMNDNNVYCIGNNHGELGLGHNNKVTEFTLIEELCDQNIEEFFGGEQFMFGRNNKNQIFSWGRNNHGQLARGYHSDHDEYLKPIKIDFFDNKNIIEISCGFCHCLGLTEDGLIYGWGSNFGQIRSRNDNNEEIILETPIEIQISDCLYNRFKFIHCLNFASCAVTVDGRAYVWGEIEMRRTFLPELIETNVTKMYLQPNYGICILTNVGILKKFRNFEMIFQCSNVTNLLYYYILQKEDNIYDISENKLEKTSFSNFHEYYLHNNNRIVETIHINSDGYLMRPNIVLNLNTNEKLLKKTFDNIYDRKLEEGFEIIQAIGSGSFGIVFQVKNNSDNQIFAVKRIRIKGKTYFLMKTLNVNEFIIVF